jgi:hypothetical protein
MAFTTARYGAVESYPDDADIRCVVESLIRNLESEKLGETNDERSQVAVRYGDWAVTVMASGLMFLDELRGLADGRPAPRVFKRAASREEAGALLALMAHGQVEAVRAAGWLQRDEVAPWEQDLFRQPRSVQSGGRGKERRSASEKWLVMGEPVGCAAALATCFFAIAGFAAFVLVEEMRFDSRALSAEAKVVQVGPAPRDIPVYGVAMPLLGRNVLIRCDKLPDEFAIVRWWGAPHPGDRVAILYESDPQRIGRFGHDPDYPLDNYMGSTGGIKLTGWDRFPPVPFLWMLLFSAGSLALFFTASIIDSYLRAKWRERKNRQAGHSQ